MKGSIANIPLFFMRIQKLTHIGFISTIGIWGNVVITQSVNAFMKNMVIFAVAFAVLKNLFAGEQHEIYWHFEAVL